MGKNIEEIKTVKGFLPRAIKYAGDMNEDFAEGLAGFYKAVWDEREGGLSMKEKHLLVFTVACSNNNTESAVKILERLKKFGATRTEITDAMMMAAWTGGIQYFTDFSAVVLKEMDKLGF
ncbi:carboxymuconolactone decarboxylase family protein [Methanosarcina sp. KYL-1]|uniref:carboxymuconolactone decarboxylase family protein n=1 Tax=Methanosarcina sp. KYL-1 TaxID=2602068 RepID=UPI002101BBC0|nr:carboxymuconolactone decarboxylase family protein [Methanosarcina sp. KYL-1]MCQ1534798.1 carboxymuconolactone decarboxylase family protein [Methanosarcina sp. KYL-1]